VCRLQLPPLGRLEKLLIGHNGLGGSRSWHLSLVEVVEETSGRVTYFAADRYGYKWRCWQSSVKEEHA
jgi:hypothetical protein